MLSSALADAGPPAMAARSGGPACEVDGAVRDLSRNELLFETGDIKASAFRVETGALCLYITRPDLTLEVIEFALAGDIVGMGFLERHACNARATVETTVSLIPLDAVEQITGNDERAKTRYDAAVAREFAFRRDALVNAGRERPLVRLASFLLAVSRRNLGEGRDPMLVDDTAHCAIVADYLGLSIDLLALALLQLEMRGLVEAAPHGALRLLDLYGLEALADEDVEEVEVSANKFAELLPV